MGIKKIKFFFIHYVIKSKFLDVLFRSFLTLLYVLSEAEVMVQSPGDWTPLRNFYLKMSGVSIGYKAYLARGIIIYNGHKIKIGNYASIGERSMLHAHANITIGNDFLAAPGLTINSGSHSLDNLEPIAKPTKIGDRVWCGVNVTILGEVQIGDDVVIGAGSLVTRDVPNNSLVVGIPAKVIKKISRPDINIWKWYQGN